MADFARESDELHEHELVQDEELLVDDEPAPGDVAQGRGKVRSAQTDLSRASSFALRVGTVLADKYRLERIHAPGARGVRADAEHLQLGQSVALKVLSADTRLRPDHAARFLRGARLSAQLRNEHIARILDLGTLDSGVPYVVTEHLSGTDLRGVLRVREWLPVPEAVDYVLQACIAVAEAHAAGFLHRNLKLTNLFLARDPSGRAGIQVLDFCMADDTVADASQIFSSHASVASLAYLAPEQLRQPDSADLRVDIWALGAILHELLSGVPVYAGTSAPGLFSAIAADAPVPITQLRPEVPAELEAIVLRCLEKERNYRYAGLGEFSKQLLRFASAEGRNSVDRVIQILERRSRRPRRVSPSPLDIPELIVPKPRKDVAASAPVSAPVIPLTRRRRGRFELAALTIGILGCSVGVGAFLTIRSLNAALAARPSATSAVVAMLSPALTASQTALAATSRGETSAARLQPPPTPLKPVAHAPRHSEPTSNDSRPRTPYDDDFAEPADTAAASKSRTATASAPPRLFDDAN